MKLGGPAPWSVALVAFLLSVLAIEPALAQKNDKGLDKGKANKNSESSESQGIGNPFGGLFGDDDEDEAGERDGKAISAYQSSGFDYQAAALDRPRTLGLFRSAAYGLVAEPSLDAYLNRVVQRLIAASPEKNIAAQVYVTTDTGFNGQASPDGGILITLGLLRDLENEDELAFVLAHEVAHVLLRHHDKDWYINTQRRTVVKAELVHEAASKLNQSTGLAGGMTQDLETGAKIGSLLYDANAILLDPAWTREQEDEADILGLDIMIAAGYNMGSSITLLEKMDAWEKQLEAIKLAASEQSEDDGTNELGVAPATSIGDLFSTMLDEAADVVAEEKAERQREHVPAAERNTVVQNYMLNEYLTEVPPPVTPVIWHGGAPAGAAVRARFANYDAARDAFDALAQGNLKQAEALARKAVGGSTKHDAYPRMAFHDVRLSQGQRDKARRNLELAMAGPEPSFLIYIKLIEDAVARQDWATALAQVEEARSRLADTPNLLPYRIEIYPHVGRQTEVADLVVTCRSEYPVLEPRCLAAAGQGQ